MDTRDETGSTPTAGDAKTASLGAAAGDHAATSPAAAASGASSADAATDAPSPMLEGAFEAPPPILEAPPPPLLEAAPSEADAAPAAEPPTLDDAIPDEAEHDALSPAVRRLVRQYDVDIRKIQGSGPSGRVRVSDVMAYLGGRTYVPPEPLEPAAQPKRAPAEATDRLEPGRPAPARDQRAREPAQRDSAAAGPDDSADASPRSRPAPGSLGLAPITTVFECELGAVLAHRKQLRQRNVDVVLTSYFLVAASEALRAVPEAAEGHEPVRIGAALTFAEGNIQTAMVDAPDGSAFESLHDRLLAVDKEFRFSARSAELNPRLIDLMLHHHGASGSIVAAPTPIGEGHAASIGIGKLRREIVVGGGEDDVAPRIAARCYVSLSFHPDRLELARANRFMGQLVRVLEQWPAA